MLVFDMIGLHMVFAYPKLGRRIVLKVETSACFTLMMVTFIQYVVKMSVLGLE